MSEQHDNCGCEEFQSLQRGFSRRGFLGGVLALGGGLAISVEPGFDYALAAPGETRADVIVMVSMRGGMDGLMAVPVLGDPLLQSYRPTTAVRDSENLSLDNHFGLHKNLSDFKKMFDNQELAIVHAVGTPTGTRSHFDDQLSIELAAYDNPDTTTGWQTRYLKAIGSTEVLTGFAASKNKAAGFTGSTVAATFDDLTQVTIDSVGSDRASYLQLLKEMHKNNDHQWAKTGLMTIDASERLRSVATDTSVSYPQSAFGRRMKLLATLLKAGTPIKTANIDFGGDLDVHDQAGVAVGTMADNFKDLNDSIAAFKSDVGPLWNNTTITTVTEFGRRLRENASAGVDHGWGSAMFVMGGGVKGGKVVANWPGLEERNLHNGDLAVTLDYRHVLSDVLRYRGNLSTAEVNAIFPGFKFQDLGLARQLG